MIPARQQIRKWISTSPNQTVPSTRSKRQKTGQSKKTYTCSCTVRSFYIDHNIAAKIAKPMIVTMVSMLNAEEISLRSSGTSEKTGSM